MDRNIEVDFAYGLLRPSVKVEARSGEDRLLCFFVESRLN